MNFIVLPLLVGVFGWFIIWGMVKMIFYPIQPIQIGPLKWESLAHRWVSSIDLKALLPEMAQKDSFEALKPVINEKLDDFFRHKLSEKMPMISMFIGENTIQELKGVFMEELAILFPVLLQQFSANLNKDLQQQWQSSFSGIVYKKIDRSTKPLRWVAFGLGLIWGLFIALILPLI